MSRLTHLGVNYTIGLWLACSALSACGGKDAADSGASGGAVTVGTTGGASAATGSGGAGTLASSGGSAHATTGGATGIRSTIVGTGGTAASGGTSSTRATGGNSALVTSGGTSSTRATGGNSALVTSGGTSSTRATGGTSSAVITGGSSALVATDGGSSTRVATGGMSGTLHTVPSQGGSQGVGGSSAPSLGGTSTSGGASSGSPVGGDAAVQAFTTDYVTPYCVRLAECCTKAGYAAPTAARCASYELNFYINSLADGSAQPNPDAISQFLNQIATSCDQPSYALRADLTLGTRPAGADCTDVSQCAGTSVACFAGGTATVGKCTPLARGANGDSAFVGCDNTSSCRWTVLGAAQTQGVACWDEDGLRYDSASNTCVPLAPIGGDCDFVECGVHATCMNGKCVAKGKLNESCSDGRACESTLSCNSSSICEKTSIAWSSSCES